MWKIPRLEDSEFATSTRRTFDTIFEAILVNTVYSCLTKSRDLVSDSISSRSE